MAKCRLTFWLLATLALTFALVAPRSSSAVTWNSTFESNTTDATLIEDIDTKINEIKEATRERADVEHAISSSTGNDLTETGRHLVGSARAFRVTTDTDCSTITTLTETDNAASNALDAGRLCIDSTDGEMCVWDGVSAWDCFYPVPSTAVLLFAGACPTGFSDISAAHERNVLRVIDVPASGDGDDPDIPETPATACTATGGECGGATAEYDDTLDTAEMPAHTHDVDLGTTVSGAGTNAATGGAPSLTDATSLTGGGDPHYHPLSVFRLCQKD